MKEFELLKPSFLETIDTEFNEYLAELRSTFLFIEKGLKKSPEGTLYARKSHGVAQYYCKLDKKYGNQKHIPKYIQKKDMQFARQLAQKRYYSVCKDVIEKQIKAMENFMVDLKKAEIPAVYGALPELVKTLVSPVTLSDEKYAEEWMSEEYGSNENHELSGGFFTSGGLRVRSKSEVIIGDVLHRMGIPFKYEFPVELKRADRFGSYTAHPDFYCLNVRTRKEFIWEHFGMMDDADYVEKMVRKLADFQKSGWFYGQNMLFTLETSRQPLDTRNIELLAKTFLV